LSADRSTAMTDRQFINEILKFYKESGRHDLPWRKNINSYKVLVSEIMLQQTQVVRVIPKFTLWMKTYPTLTAFSRASFKDVLILWQGLGYQRRAKALYQLAQTTTRIPASFEELLKLSGIGPYTAGAICAFAYDSFSHPVLETNIRTVLIESFHPGEQQIHDGILYDDLARLEKNITIKKLGARAWYYALMDYGAHLKQLRISHNKKSAHYTKQSAYEGSLRQLRAKTLFAITHQEKLPSDERLETVLSQLIKEGYIIKTKNKYQLIKL
jgi:A/G-specific adenine glycosylase